MSPNTNRVGVRDGAVSAASPVAAVTVVKPPADPLARSVCCVAAGQQILHADQFRNADHLASPVNLPADVDHEVDRRLDLLPDRPDRKIDSRHQHQRLEPGERIPRTIGVDRGHRAVVSGVQRRQQREQQHRQIGHRHDRECQHAHDSYRVGPDHDQPPVEAVGDDAAQRPDKHHRQHPGGHRRGCERARLRALEDDHHQSEVVDPVAGLRRGQRDDQPAESG
jgi:hypothetical protein